MRGRFGMSAADVLKKISSELLDSPVNDLHLVQIAKDLRNWEEVTPFLGLSPAQEEEVRRTHFDYGEQKREALRKWKQMKGNGATYRQLIIVLGCVQNIELADKVATLLSTPELESPQKRTTSGGLDTLCEYLIDCYKATRHPSHEQWHGLC